MGRIKSPGDDVGFRRRFFDDLPANRWLTPFSRDKQMTHPSPETDLDLIAVGAHPDDVEVGCGGTLAMLVKQGYRVGIVDLTDGEPTPLCPNPETRRREAEQAAKILGRPAKDHP